MILTPENEYSVLLDACVLVPMPLCDTLLRLAEEPAFYRPLWSEQILQEVGSTLEQKFHKSTHQVERRLGFMREHFPEALVVVPDDLPKALTCIPDENDRHVLAAAIRGGANAIVTLNYRDFPEDCLQQYGIMRQSPDDFLVHQFHLNSNLLLEKFDEQASLIREEREKLLARFEQSTPQFYALMSERL